MGCDACEDSDGRAVVNVSYCASVWSARSCGESTPSVAAAVDHNAHRLHAGHKYTGDTDLAGSIGICVAVARLIRV